MASGTRLRESGQRKPQKKRGNGIFVGGLELEGGRAGESRLNLDQVYAIQHLFESHPAVNAARAVLHGQLLSGGVCLKKGGSEVELTAEFKQHLDDIWLPFAGDVVDSFIKWGICVVVYEDEEVEERSSLRKRAREEESSKKSRARQAVEKPPHVVIPMVPPLGSYEVAWRQGGRAGYKRKYLVYSTASTHATREDEEARVFLRNHPDATGNVNSPMASIFELGSFVGALNELAIVAESSRARPRYTTQMAKKDANSLDPSNLFFDSESRAVQSGTDNAESAQAARSLQLQQQLCGLINRLQTTQNHDHGTGSFAGSGRPGSSSSYAPYEVQPQLFCLPKGQELAPHGQQPESRGDLEALSRLAMEQISAAMGVPADLIFSGRFAGKSTSQ